MISSNFGRTQGGGVARKFREIENYFKMVFAEEIKMKLGVVQY